MTIHHLTPGTREIDRYAQGILRERVNSGKTSNVDSVDSLDQALDSMHNQQFLTEDFIVQMIFPGIFASSESMSSMLAMIFKLMSENLSVLEELRVRGFT